MPGEMQRLKFPALALLSVAFAAANPPNILFVLTDDMGWGDVSYNKELYQPGAGGKNWTVNPPRTPHIDALATGENTMLFRRWYTGSAVCSPTRVPRLPPSLSPAFLPRCCTPTDHRATPDPCGIYIVCA